MHSILSMQTNNQINSRTNNKELLKHKVRYLEKELAISNSKLAKYYQDGVNKSMEEHSNSMERPKQQIEDMEAERDALIIRLNNLENSASICPRCSEKVSGKEPLKSIETILDTKLVSVEERGKETMIK